MRACVITVLRSCPPQVVPNAKRLTLEQFLFRQQQILHGYESRELRFVPKILHAVLARLGELMSEVEEGKKKKEDKEESEVVEVASDDRAPVLNPFLLRRFVF